MSTNKSILYIPLPVLLICMAGLCRAQVDIKGPACIVPGVEYQYNFYGKWQKGASVDICIVGGIFTESTDTCITVKDSNSVLVIWNESAGEEKLSVSSSGETGYLTVTATQNLQGGLVDQNVKSQQKRENELPDQITCASATGGSCNPSYSYQWEQSADNLHWEEIEGATSQHLSFEKTLNNTVFLRRKVIDKSSGSVAYSDVAIVVIENVSE